MGIASWWNKLRGWRRAAQIDAASAASAASAADAGGTDGAGGAWPPVVKPAEPTEPEAFDGATGSGIVDPDASARRVATRKGAGGLLIHEYRHALRAAGGPLAVRTFLTEGLEALGAREVRATVPVAWDEAASSVAPQMLASLQPLAAGGRPALLGGWTGFETPGLGGGKLVGVTYARGTPIRGVPGAEAALVAVLLHAEELELVQRGLMTRVLGRLASRARIFPYPPCWEVRAQPVLRAADQAASLLEQVPRATVGDLRVTELLGPPAGERLSTILVSLPGDAAAAMETIWSDASLPAVALLAKLAPDADGQATWEPGSTERTGNGIGTAPPRRLGYGFVMFVGTEEPAPDLRYIEDGIGLLLPGTSLERLRAALRAGEDVALPVGEDGRLAIEFRRDAQGDPFTGGQLRATGGWERFRPDAPRPQVGPVKIEQIVLLVSEQELRERVEAAALASFIASVEQILEQLAEQHPVDAAMELAIGLQLAPGRPPKVQLAFRGADEAALLGPLLAELEALAPAPVRGEVSFRIDAAVAPEAATN